MQIFVKWSTEVFPLECESTDTIAQLKAKVHDIEGIPHRDGHDDLVFDDRILDENKTLADIGVKEGSMFQLIYIRPLRDIPELGGAGPIEWPRFRRPRKQQVSQTATNNTTNAEHVDQAIYNPPCCCNIL